MNLNELIMESIKTTITEGKKEKQDTSIRFGGSDGPGIKDTNVEGKNKSSVEDGLSGDIDKKNKNPQGEGGEDVIKQHPKLAAAVTAGVINVGAKINKNPNVKFTPPAPATK